MSRNYTPDGAGAWLPWDIAEAAFRLRLRPASRWNVFWAVLLVWARYGREVAFLTCAQIAGMTGYTERTVKAALADLFKLGLVKREGRAGKLRIDAWKLLDLSKHDSEPSSEREDMVAPVRGKQDCPSPTSVYVSRERGTAAGRRRGFTSKQRRLISEILSEVSVMSSDDVQDAEIAEADLHAIGLNGMVTIKDGLGLLRSTGTPRQCQQFVAYLIRLKKELEREGEDLILQA